MTEAELVENFGLLSDWEDKYAYLIELGQGLAAFPEADKTEANKVQGCQSQVWLTARQEGGKYFFNATSDALIVRGLEAVLLTLVNGKTAEEIQAADIQGTFEKLGLSEHLSAIRRNGFAALIQRIKKLSSTDRNVSF